LTLFGVNFSGHMRLVGETGHRIACCAGARPPNPAHQAATAVNHLDFQWTFIS
jgi:hypothetical protein